MLFDYAEGGDDPETSKALRELVVVRNDQRVFNEVFEASPQRLDFADDGLTWLIRLPAYVTAEIVVDPNRGFGQLVFERGGARVEDALAMFRAREDLEHGGGGVPGASRAV